MVPAPARAAAGPAAQRRARCCTGSRSPSPTPSRAAPRSPTSSAWTTSGPARRRAFWDSFRIGLVWAVARDRAAVRWRSGLALLLNQNLRFRGLARVLALVPWAMPPVVVGIMWRLVYHPDAGHPQRDPAATCGLIAENVDWLADFSIALPAVIVVGVWAGMPQTTVVLLAGSAGRAAGAARGGRGRRRRRLAPVPERHLPPLRPVIVAITSLDFIWNFNSFGLVYVLTRAGPAARPGCRCSSPTRRRSATATSATPRRWASPWSPSSLALLGVYPGRQMQGGDQ